METNKLFYDTLLNNNILVERMPKRRRHPKSGKGRLVGPDRVKPRLAEFQSTTSYGLQKISQKTENNNLITNSFPISELVNFQIEPIKSRLPFAVKINFLFVLKSCSELIGTIESEKTILCDSIEACALEAKAKCKANEAKIEELLDTLVGHIVPIKLQGKIIGYGVSLLGVEIELCLPKTETKKMPKINKHIHLSKLSSKELYKKMA